MSTVIITIKRNGYIHFKFIFLTKHMVLVIKSTVAMRRIYFFNQTHGVGNQKYCRNETVLLGTQNIKPWLQIQLTRLQNFVKV